MCSWRTVLVRRDVTRRWRPSLAFQTIFIGTLVSVLCLSDSPTEICAAEAPRNVESALSGVHLNQNTRAPQLLKKMRNKIAVPAESFPSSSSLYHLIFLARKLLARRALGAEPPKSQEATRLDGLLKSQAYQKILRYPGDLWPQEREQKCFPSSAEFDWGSLSQQPVPGFDVQPLPPWMHSANVEEVELAPSYVNVRHKSALLKAAWFSCPRAFRARLELSESDAGSSGVDDALSTTSHDVEEQKEIGQVPRLPVLLYTPALDTRTRRPLNPILFASRRLVSPKGAESGDRCSSSSDFPRHHLTGRGVLGKWGANHAADALLTARNPVNGKLQVALIRRTDGSGKFAVPGGFVDPTDGPLVVTPIVREFLEEAVSYEDGDHTDDGHRRYQETLGALRNVFGPFSRDSKTGGILWQSDDKIKWGHLIYAGYVDDERNTNNAWMETIVLHWHVSGEDYKHLHLQAGDDASLGSAAFYDIDEDPRLVVMGVDPLKDLYASHSAFLVKTIETYFPDETVLLTKIGAFRR